LIGSIRVKFDKKVLSFNIHINRVIFSYTAVQKNLISMLENSSELCYVSSNLLREFYIFIVFVICILRNILKLLWILKKLFSYFYPRASIVCVKDYGLHTQKYWYNNFVCMFDWLTQFFSHWNDKKSRPKC